MLGYNEHITSLDAPIDADAGISVGDQLADDDAPSPELVLHNSEIEGWIKQWLDELSDRQREVIERRYGLDGHDVATLEQLASALASRANACARSSPKRWRSCARGCAGAACRATRCCSAPAFVPSVTAIAVAPRGRV